MLKNWKSLVAGVTLAAIGTGAIIAGLNVNNTVGAATDVVRRAPTATATASAAVPTAIPAPPQGPPPAAPADPSGGPAGVGIGPDALPSTGSGPLSADGDSEVLIALALLGTLLIGAGATRASRRR